MQQLELDNILSGSENALTDRQTDRQTDSRRRWARKYVRHRKH